jgi:hypothetical protein
MELILRVALVDLRYHIDCATFVRLRPNTRRLANVSSSAATSGEFAFGGFALDAFADKASVSVNSVVSANVAGAYISNQLLCLQGMQYLSQRTRLTSTSSRMNWCGRHLFFFVADPKLSVARIYAIEIAESWCQGCEVSRSMRRTWQNANKSPYSDFFGPANGATFK